MKEQRPPLRFPAQRKARGPRKLRPPTKDCPRCENMLNRRKSVDDGLGGGTYAKLPPEQCAHKGRPYKLNGLLTMVLCICCARKIMRKSNITLRQVRRKLGVPSE
ncbi:MAG TPA: hypothetical protein VGU67_02825 [Edaphobacter sp.]|nr:hypothetical protein [Edaphobacter sp.]